MSWQNRGWKYHRPAAFVKTPHHYIFVIVQRFFRRLVAWAMDVMASETMTHIICPANGVQGDACITLAVQKKKGRPEERPLFKFEFQKRLLRSFQLLVFSFHRLWCGFNRQVDPFNDRTLSSITLPLIQANNPSVATLTIFKNGGDLVEQDVNDIFALTPSNTRR